jgi:hypothetical protein
MVLMAIVGLLCFAHEHLFVGSDHAPKVDENFRSAPR